MRPSWRWVVIVAALMAGMPLVTARRGLQERNKTTTDNSNWLAKLMSRASS